MNGGSESAVPVVSQAHETMPPTIRHAGARAGGALERRAAAENRNHVDKDSDMILRTASTHRGRRRP